MEKLLDYPVTLSNGVKIDAIPTTVVGQMIGLLIALEESFMAAVPQKVLHRMANAFGVDAEQGMRLARISTITSILAELGLFNKFSAKDVSDFVVEQAENALKKMKDDDAEDCTTCPHRDGCEFGNSCN